MFNVCRAFHSFEDQIIPMKNSLFECHVIIRDCETLISQRNLIEIYEFYLEKNT